VPLRRDGLPLPCDAAQQLACANRLPFERHDARFELREVEQLLDEVRQPFGLLQQPRERRRVRRLDSVDEVLELGAQGADRGAQLVRGIRDEVTPYAVDLRELGSHAVERTRELAHLVA
jgi:hypothetical protein